MNKKYNINTFAIEQMKELIHNGDDNHNNQIRVSKNGYIFLSEDITGMVNLDDIKYRMETFIAGNEYVGQQASEDKAYVESLYEMFTTAWSTNLNDDFLDESFMSVRYDDQLT